MPSFDAVVVGAGPAGLSAAAELSLAGACLLLDQGRDPHHRDRHASRDILSGIGGAGLFSDGKHSFYPSASALWTLPDHDRLAAAFDRTARLLASHGVPAAPWRPDAAPAPNPGAWHVKHYPSIYMPLAERMATIAELAAACPQRWTGARVVAAARDGADLRLTVDRDGALHHVSTRALVVATGRLSPRWVRPWLTPLAVRFAFRRLEFGVRIETASDAPLFRRLDGVDPKLRLVEPDGASEVRTFCVCRDGEVVLGEPGDPHHPCAGFSGRADGPPSGRSNLGLLVRVLAEPLARAVEPALFAARPTSLPLRAAGPATLGPLFGERGAAAVVRALEHLRGWCPGLADVDATVHAPCIEGVGDYPVDDGALRLAPGVWIAGDACGRFRGIVASMVSGRYVALQVARA